MISIQLLLQVCYNPLQISEALVGMMGRSDGTLESSAHGGALTSIWSKA